MVLVVPHGGPRLQLQRPGNLSPGCDLLTISPNLLEELQSTEGDLPCKLLEETAKQCDCTKISLNETAFRRELNEDACATEKLSEGIRRFAADTVKLEDFLRSKMI